MEARPDSFSGFRPKDDIGKSLLPQARFRQRNCDLAVCFGREGVQSRTGSFPDREGKALFLGKGQICLAMLG